MRKQQRQIWTYSTKHNKNSHICEEDGAQLKSFFLAFTDELEKQILKKLLKWANKKQNNFNIYNAAFKKIK